MGAGKTEAHRRLLGSAPLLGRSAKRVVLDHAPPHLEQHLRGLGLPWGVKARPVLILLQQGLPLH